MLYLGALVKAIATIFIIISCSINISLILALLS